MPERTSVAGVATGLAVTGVGGDVLFVEATSMAGESGTLTVHLCRDVREVLELALEPAQATAAAA